MSTASAPSWRHMPPIPRPLQRLFDAVPLLTYEANELPARAQSSTSSDLPTLYVFSSEEDARLGLPSFNPGCLKWQTFLKLSNLQFKILPSTNHASPTGSLPFLLPARKDVSSSSSSPASSTTATTTAPIKPIPSSKLYDYVLSQKPKSPSSSSSASPPPPPPAAATTVGSSSSLRQEAYQSLIDISLRNAFLYTLYLDPRNSQLLDKLYITPCTSSSWIRTTLRHQLRRAAESEILKTTHAVSSGGPHAGFGHGVVRPGEIYRSAADALDALAHELESGRSSQGDDNGEGGGGGGKWFFGAKEPDLFDVGVFAYTYLMVRFFSSPSSSAGQDAGKEEKEASERSGVLPSSPSSSSSLLGDMVKQAGGGNGALLGHMNMILELTWPDLL